jgi:hypothetical protein
MVIPRRVLSYFEEAANGEPRACSEVHHWVKVLLSLQTDGFLGDIGVEVVV